MLRDRFRVALPAAVLGAMLAVPILAGSAAAFSPAGQVFHGPGPDAGLRAGNIDIFACSHRDGTNPWAVPAGVSASITEFWLTRTEAQAQQFIDTSVLDVDVNGVPVANPGAYWELRAPSEEGGLWLASWVYETGVVTRAGRTITVHYQHDLPDGTYDGFDTLPPGTVLFDLTCTAKALGSRDSSIR